jgi:hypothetical protein
MSLNLHALANAVVRESASPDPDLMVMEFVSRIDPADHTEALRLLARDFIRQSIRNQREALNGGAPGGSRKVANAREAWKRLLDSPEFLPSTASWIFLRDATHDQVLEMAGVRQQKARELTAAAKQYKRIADEMAAKGAPSVGDLPDDMLEQLLAPVSKKAVKAA